MTYLLRLLGIGWAIATLHGEVCGLTIAVVDEFGVSTPYRVRSFRDAAGADQQPRFRGLSATSLPCGRYKYVVSRSDVNAPVADIGGEVLVNDAHQWLTINPSRELIIGKDGTALAVDSFSPPNYKVLGKLRPVPSGRQAFVRLIAIYSPQALSAAVAADGTFEFTHHLWGKYVLVVVQGETVLATQLLAVESNEPPHLEIDVGSPKPYTIYK
ncbi:MAG: hypothetical protein HYX26_09865 [Acidobacteriales bacterium]|nr:hypothetical protein [Terriglobales bacterium]